MKRLFFLLLLLSVCFSGFSEETPQEIFLNGNKLYSEKEYQKAIDSYLQLLALGYQNYSVNYNLGCSYYHLNQLGLARYYFEKAFIHAPFNKDLENNLSLVIEKINGEEGIESDNLAVKRILLLFQPYIVLGFFILLFLIYTVIFFLLIKKFNKRLFTTATAAFLVSIFLFVFALIQNIVINDHSAIVIKNTDVYLAPYSSTVISHIDEGKKISLLKQENQEYYMIKLSDSTNGWLKNDAVLPIRY